MSIDSKAAEKLMELVPTVYTDLAQPAVQKLGIALSSIVGIVATPTSSAALILEKNLERFIKKLDKEELSNILPILPEIGVPALEKLRYVSSEEMANLFTELLLKSALKTSQDNTHPGYLEILNNLTADEAKILHHLKITKKVDIPFIEMRRKITDQNGYYVVSRFLTTIPYEVNLMYPQNIEIYLDNLVRVGLIAEAVLSSFVDEGYYNPILDGKEYVQLKSKVEEVKNQVAEPHKSYFNVTSYGKMFLKVCVPTILSE